MLRTTNPAEARRDRLILWALVVIAPVIAYFGLSGSGDRPARPDSAPQASTAEPATPDTPAPGPTGPLVLPAGAERTDSAPGPTGEDEAGTLSPGEPSAEPGSPRAPTAGAASLANTHWDGPTSPELPNKFERAKFTVPAQPIHISPPNGPVDGDGVRRRVWPSDATSEARGEETPEAAQAGVEEEARARRVPGE